MVAKPTFCKDITGLTFYNRKTYLEVEVVFHGCALRINVKPAVSHGYSDKIRSTRPAGILRAPCW